MSVIDQIEAMPDGGMLPASYLKQAVKEIRREAITLAATEEGTIQMWCELATRNLCEDPTKTYEPVDETRHDSGDYSDADRDVVPSDEVESWLNPNGDEAKSGPTSPGAEA